MADTIFDELKNALKDFKDFLDANVGTIKPAIDALKSIIPDQINDLLGKLGELMTKLKTEIQNLDVSAIPGLGEAAEFTGKIGGFVEAAKKLLPGDVDEFDAVLAAADVVTGLPSIDDVKAEIIALIDAIVGHINTLKA
jgi:phage tail tape-measure protein